MMYLFVFFMVVGLLTVGVLALAWWVRNGRFGG